MQKVRINRVIEEVQLVTAAIDAFSPASGKKVSGLDYRSYVDVSALEQAVSVIGGGFHGLNSGQDERYSYYMRFGRIPQELCLALVTQLNDGTGRIRVSQQLGYGVSVLVGTPEARNLCEKEGNGNIDIFFGCTSEPLQ